MASAEAVLIMDARDNASAQIRHFAGTVKEAEGAIVSARSATMSWTEYLKGRMGPAMKEFGGHAAAMKELGKQYREYKAQLQDVAPVTAKAAEATQKLTGGIDNTILGLRRSLMPLRAFSNVMMTLGLGAVGLYTLTSALRGTMTSILQNEQALIGAQITLRRWGLTVDDTRRLTETFSAVLGRTAGTTLAGIEESMARWLLSFGPQRVEILRAAQAIETWTGIPVATTLAAWKTEMDEGRGSIARWMAEAKNAEAATSDFQKAWVSLQQTTGPILEWLVTQSMKVGAGIAKGLTWSLVLTPKEQKAYEERLKFYRETLQFTLSSLGKDWQGFTDSLGLIWAGFTSWLGAQWAGLGVEWEAAMTALGDFFREKWEGLGAWWTELMSGIGDFFMEKWTGLATWWAGLVGGLLGFFRDKWTAFTSWWGELIGNIGAFFVEKWTAVAEWWGRLTTGIGDFWRGIWEGMKTIALDVYDWIMDKLNNAIDMVNVLIRLFNQIPLVPDIAEITTRFTHATRGVEEVIAPASVFTAPIMPAGIGGNIIIPVYIGDKPLTEIIIDALTGAVRQRELSA